MFSIFTNHLAGENTLIMAMVQRLNVQFGIWGDVDATDAFASSLPARFLRTQLKHNVVMSQREYWRIALETASFLEERE